MDIEKFRTFVMVARFGSFNEAAEALFLSASTVSKHISALEHELGVTLFDRQPKKAVLTEKGKLCLEYAEKSIRRYDAFVEMLRGNGVVRIASFPVQNLLFRLTESFSEQYPGVRVQIDTEHGSAVIKAVEDGKYEIGFVGLSYSGRPSLERHIVSRDRKGIVLSEKHPLAKRESISLKELKNESFYFLAPETGMYQACVDMCEKQGFKPVIAGTSSREDNLLAMVRGGGAAFFSKKVLSFYNHDGLRFVPLREEFIGGTAFIRVKGRTLSEQAACFWEFVVKNTK